MPKHISSLYNTMIIIIMHYKYYGGRRCPTELRVFFLTFKMKIVYEKPKKNYKYNGSTIFYCVAFT